MYTRREIKGYAIILAFVFIVAIATVIVFGKKDRPKPVSAKPQSPEKRLVEYFNNTTPLRYQITNVAGCAVNPKKSNEYECYATVIDRKGTAWTCGAFLFVIENNKLRMEGDGPVNRSRCGI